MERLVSEANKNVPVRPLFSKNIHSTDDSGVYFVSAHNDTVAVNGEWQEMMEQILVLARTLDGWMV